MAPSHGTYHSSPGALNTKQQKDTKITNIHAVKNACYAMLSPEQGDIVPRAVLKYTQQAVHILQPPRAYGCAGDTPPVGAWGRCVLVCACVQAGVVRRQGAGTPSKSIDR